MKQASKASNRCRAGSFFLVWLLCAIASPAMAQKGNPTNGGKLFADKCEKCHAKDGSGDTVIGKALNAADLRSTAVQKLSDAAICNQIDKGKGNMPPFGGSLDKAQINDLVAFVRQLGKTTAGKKR